MMGGGTGPAHGHVSPRRSRPGPWHLGRMLQAAEGFPMNLGFFGKGQHGLSRPASRSRSRPAPAGLKLHEDWGTTPAAIDNCLTVADRMDVQVAIHTDTLNEIGLRRDHARRRLEGPAPSPTFHTEGRGAAAMRPTSSGCAARRNVMPSSTNPTMPYTVNTVDEHLDMLMVLPPSRSGDPRGRGPSPKAASGAETIAAEDILHDLGAFSMMSSDSQAMGRVGEGRDPHLADRRQDEEAGAAG